MLDGRDSGDSTEIDQAIEAPRVGGDTGRLAFLQTLKEQTGRRDTELLYLDLARDQYAVAIGHLAAARHIAVLVPGVAGDADQCAVLNWIPYARAIHTACQAEGAASAVIMWKGYQDPTPEQAWSTRFAAAGGASLAAFCEGLARDRQQTLTVIGHSYGSLVTGLALADHGLRPTNVIALGSPGMGVDRLTELHLRPEQFFTESASGDPITALGFFGTDPSAPGFGGTRMSTGRRRSRPSPTLHSAYFAPGSDSLRNIVDVVIGKYDRVTAVPPGHGDHCCVVVHAILNPFQDRLDTFVRRYSGRGAGLLSVVVHVDDLVANLAGDGARIATDEAVLLGRQLLGFAGHL